ncbi:hypothetical protein D3C84_809910 [compost metagenome]
MSVFEANGGYAASIPMRRVFSAANTELHANRLRARPVMRGNFFMFVFSRLLLVWQDRRKS